MDTPSASVLSLFPLSAAFRPSGPERFCRLCLENRHTARQQQFFTDGEPVNPELLEGIRSLLNIEIVLPEDLHARICMRCLRVLEDFFYFRERCQAVDLRVRERRAKNPSQPPPLLAPEVSVFEIRSSTPSPNLPPTPPEQHENENQVLESTPLVRTPLDTTMAILDSMSYLQDPVDEPERVLNIEKYNKEIEPEMPDLPVPVLDEQDSPRFYQCIERGLSMALGGYYYILSQVRFEGGSCMWQCTWSNCKVALEANSQLTTFKLLSEHAHPPPDRSDLDETTKRTISQDGAFAELAACPANDGQTALPEVTFYRPAKSVIGVRHDGFQFRLNKFLAGGKSLWDCTWRGCSVQLELAGTLDCRLVPVDKHSHPRPDGPVGSVVSTISPVKALMELSGMRGLAEKQPQQDEQIVREILEGKRQPQIMVTKVQLPCLARLLAIRRNSPRLSFIRYRRTIGMIFEKHYFDLARYSKTGASWWKCGRKSSDMCQVRIALGAHLDLLSIHPNRHRHRRFKSLPVKQSRGEPISAEEFIEELLRNRGSQRRNKKFGILENLNGRKIVPRISTGSSSTSTSCSSFYSADSI